MRGMQDVVTAAEAQKFFVIQVDNEASGGACGGPRPTMLPPRLPNYPATHAPIAQH